MSNKSHLFNNLLEKSVNISFEKEKLISPLLVFSHILNAFFIDYNIAFKSEPK